MKKKIIHIHVAKTGGSWLNNILKQYAFEHFLPTADFDLRVAENVKEFWRDSSLSRPSARVYYDDLKYRIDHKVIEDQQSKNPPVYDDAMKVSICRNPFDMLVSFYHFQPNDDKSLAMRKYVPGGGPTGIGNCNAIHGISSFEDFVKKWCDDDFVWEWKYSESRHFLFHQMFAESGWSGVNVILRNEDLAKGTYMLLKGAGYGDYPEILKSEKLHATAARKKRDYRSFYTDELRCLVEKRHESELLCFDYNFDGIRSDSKFGPFIDPLSLFYLQESRFACRNFGSDDEHFKELVELFGGSCVYGAGNGDIIERLDKWQIACLKADQHLSSGTVVGLSEEGHLMLSRRAASKVMYAADQMPKSAPVYLGRYLIRDADKEGAPVSKIKTVVANDPVWQTETGALFTTKPESIEETFSRWMPKD